MIADFWWSVCWPHNKERCCFRFSNFIMLLHRELKHSPSTSKLGSTLDLTRAEYIQTFFFRPFLGIAFWEEGDKRGGVSTQALVEISQWKRKRTCWPNFHKNKMILVSQSHYFSNSLQNLVRFWINFDTSTPTFSTLFLRTFFSHSYFSLSPATARIRRFRIRCALFSSYLKSSPNRGRRLSLAGADY